MIKSKYIAKILAKMRIPSFDRCNIDKTCKVNYESVLAKVKMGRYSYVGARTSITDAQIGSFCSIGGKVSIGGGVHPTNMVSTSPVFLMEKIFLGKIMHRLSMNHLKLLLSVMMCGLETVFT